MRYARREFQIAMAMAVAKHDSGAQYGRSGFAKEIANDRKSNVVVIVNI